MAEEKVELQDINLRQLLPWTELFRGFQVALDPKKLLLAAAGILVMSAGWAFFSWVFHQGRHKPDVSDYAVENYKPKTIEEDPSAERQAEISVEAETRRDAAFRSDKAKWDLFEDAAGPGGQLNTWPWNENRGPNPYLLATGQAGMAWEQGKFWDWLFTKQVPILIEPLVKFLSPIRFLLKPQAGFLNNLYFTLIILWTLATWALFGGAITRMAAVELARKDKISMREALRFTGQRYWSFFSAPLFPLLVVLVVLVGLVIYGLFHLIPVFGDVVVDGLGWPLTLIAGLVMAVVLLGLAGWPLMYSSISTEGTDSFDAISRSYSYLYQNPWHYVWYCSVAIVYGAALVFFVGFMGSFIAYLGKWGVSQTPFVSENWTNREPSFLFVYAPESFGWRALMLQGVNAKVNDPSVVVDGADDPTRSNPSNTSPSSYRSLVVDGAVDPVVYEQYVKTLKPYNKVGAFLVSLWLGLVFLMVVGFGYSYFWCSSTIIYLLMRRKVDDTELDEVYLEEDEDENVYSASVSAPAPAPAASGATPLQMVDAPVLRTSAPPPAPVSVSAPAKTEASSSSGSARSEDGDRPGAA